MREADSGGGKTIQGLLFSDPHFLRGYIGIRSCLEDYILLFLFYVCMSCSHDPGDHFFP